MRDKIKTDFIVISSDLIADDDFIHQMVDMHKNRDAAVTMLIKQPIAEQQTTRAPAKPSAKANELNFDYIALDEKKERVVLLIPSADVESTFVVNKSLLRRYPHMKVFSTLQDAHFYIFSKWVLDVLEEQGAKKKVIEYKGRPSSLPDFMSGFQTKTTRIARVRFNVTPIAGIIHVL